MQDQGVARCYIVFVYCTYAYTTGRQAFSLPTATCIQAGQGINPVRPTNTLITAEWSVNFLRVKYFLLVTFLVRYQSPPDVESPSHSLANTFGDVLPTRPVLCSFGPRFFGDLGVL